MSINNNIMTLITDVTTKSNQVTFNEERGKDIISSELNQLKTTQKTKFQQDCDRAISIEEARKISHDFIKALWAK